MEITAEGAEAVVYRDGDQVVKDREPKQYRHEELDSRLRTERTDQEARLLRRAREAGVRTPDVDVQDDTTLVMDRVDGTVLRDVFEDRDDLWPRIGEAVARLHDRDIIHGDLTTSNIIVVDQEPWFIDFGLGRFSDRAEDRATDLHLLTEALDSTHTAVAEEAMDAIIEAYRAERGDATAVMERYQEIAERGRYT